FIAALHDQGCALFLAGVGPTLEISCEAPICSGFVSFISLFYGPPRSCLRDASPLPEPEVARVASAYERSSRPQERTPKISAPATPTASPTARCAMVALPLQ